MNGKKKDIKIEIIDYIIWIFFIVVFSYVISLIGLSIYLGIGIKGIMYVVTYDFLPILTIIVFLLCSFPLLHIMRLRYEMHYVYKRLKGQKKAINGNLENAHFITLKEMQKSGYRLATNKEELIGQEDGILLNFEEKKKNIQVIFAPETIHPLVLGTTGSGKTSAYIIPFLKTLSITQTKPSFIITDPKGELSLKTAWHLKEQGYDIKILDFRSPERSLRWNPIASAFEKFQNAQKVIEYSHYIDGKHYFKGKEYASETIEEAVIVEKQRLEDEAFEEILNVVSTICPINLKDPIWDNGAKSFIQAVIIAMLEDSIGYDESMTIEKFNLYNVAKICTSNDDECSDLINYFKFRPPTSRAVQYSNMVLNAPDKQRGSYMSSVAEKLLMFNDRGICSMTSGANEIDVFNMDEKPTAIYLVLPDEKEGRHPLGSLFISQSYKKLVEKSVANGERLKRRVYFVMDEFGNLPKIEGIQSMFTVGRSRGIIQLPVIQSYSQVIDKYGHELANTIFGNCNIEIFIGAKDDETCEKFSKKLGNYTIMSTTLSTADEKRDFTYNYNESVRERPLMYPRELSLLNNKNDMGNLVAINQGYSPSLGKITPYFDSKMFNPKSEDVMEMKPRSFAEKQVLYDFRKRYKSIIADYKELEELTKASENQEFKKSRNLENKQNPFEILDKLSNYAEEINRKFSNDEEQNKEIIEEIINNLRSKRQIVKLNQVLKLKQEYEKLTGEENEEDID